MESTENAEPIAWEEFFQLHLPPTWYEDTRSLIKEFCDRHKNLGTIVLVTSGGTSVPLEHNPVRFLDNFSTGSRGAASAEQFLDHGYAVIFMHRDRSLEPFSRHFTGQKFLDMLELHENGNATINVSSDSVDVLAPILTKYKEARHYLLSVPFNTIADYMWLIRAACEFLQQFDKRAIFYSGAAVSDFYVPADQMPTHKMQSNEVPTIQLAKVPKMIVPLVNLWIPRAYVVTFKLETDENLLLPKARNSLERYNHQLVIANILQTRKNRVMFVTPTEAYEVTLTKEQTLSGLEIEKPMVADVVRRHEAYIMQTDQ